MTRTVQHLIGMGLLLLGVGSGGCQPATQAQSNSLPFGDDVLAAPTLFAPGVISTGDYELNAAFEPDGRTVYFTKSTPDAGFSLMTILMARYENGAWGNLAVAPFSGQYSEVDPFLSPDGRRLYYISKRPVEGDAPRNDFDIWMVERTDAGWGAPRHLDAPVNTDDQEYFPAVSATGALYFSTRREDTNGRFDLYRSRLVDGRYAEPENLGAAVNSEHSEIDVYVDPDERFIIFVSYRPAGQGSGDLYISYHRDGQWTPAQNLGDTVNSPAREYCPMVSPDGRYLFFTSERGFADQPLEEPLTYEQLVDRIRSPGNGMGDVYYISLSALGIEP